MSMRLGLCTLALLLSACDLETTEEKRARELCEGKRYLQETVDVDPAVLYAESLREEPAQDERPALPANARPDAIIHAPLALQHTAGGMRMAFSSAWAGPVASVPLELAPGFRLRCRLRFAELDHDSCAGILLMAEEDPACNPAARSHDFIRAAECAVIFICQGGGAALVNNMLFAGKDLEQVSVERSLRQPAFLTGQTYELSVRIDEGPASCALVPASRAAEDYAPVLRTTARATPTPPGKYRLIFWASGSYPRLAVMEVGALAIEGGRVLPLSPDPLQNARHAFCADEFGKALVLYENFGAGAKLAQEDADALAFTRARSGRPLDAAWLDAALTRLPNCECLVRLWAEDALRRGKVELLHARAERLAEKDRHGSAHLAELLDELAENAAATGD